MACDGWIDYNITMITPDTFFGKYDQKGIDCSLFEVYINKLGKRYRLGRYKTLEDATKVRKEAEKKFYGEFRYVQTN